MFICTVFLATDDVSGEVSAVGTGRHRGPRAHEQLAPPQGPGHGRHRRVLESDGRHGAA